VTADAVETIHLPIVWDLTVDYPKLLGVLDEIHPWLRAAVRELRERLPVPPSTEAFVVGPYHRPPGSARSFYRAEDDDAGPDSGPVIAVKGMEPLSQNFRSGLQDLDRACYSPFTIAEHFVFEERKVPGCLTLAEATAEARRAAELQSAHLAAYGTLARVPLPLLVFRHSDDTKQDVADLLGELLSDAARAAVAAQMTSGLGVYVYVYPATPLRVTHLDYLFRGQSFQKRSLALLTVCDPDAMARRWVSAVVRMLYLGYLPGTLASLHSGICCQPQNACLNGGFVDLDSVTSFSDLRDDTAVYAALQFSMDELVRTVRYLVAGAADPVRPEETRVRVDLHHLREYVLALVREAIGAEGRPDTQLDPRVVEFFDPARSFERLAQRLSSYYSPPSRASAQAWHEFETVGRAWIDRASGADPGYG